MYNEHCLLRFVLAKNIEDLHLPSVIINSAAAEWLSRLLSGLERVKMKRNNFSSQMRSSLSHGVIFLHHTFSHI